MDPQRRDIDPSSTSPPPKKRLRALSWLRRGSRGIAIAAAALAVLVVAAVVLDVVIDEPLRRYMERKINSDLSGYSVKIGALDFHVFGLSIDLEKCTIVQNAHPDPPVAYLPKLSASVQWRALLSARLVGDVAFDRPMVHIDLKQLTEESRDPVPLHERGWQDALQDIYPLKINDLEVYDGSLVYQDLEGSRPLPITAIRFHAGNIRNAKSKKGVYPSDIWLQGVVFDHGSVRVKGEADFLAEPFPGVSGSLDLEKMELSYFDPIGRRNNLEMKGGWLDASGAFEYAPNVQQLVLRSVTIQDAVVDYVVATPGTSPTQTKLTRNVSQATKELSNSPHAVIRVDRLDVVNSEVGYRNQTAKQPYRLFVTEGRLELRNLSNQQGLGSATANLSGRFMGNGKLLATADFRAKEKPDFDLDLKIEEAQMTSMNDLFRAHAKLDVVAGRFSYYMQVHVRDGYMTGYVKPLFHDVDIYDPRQDCNKSFFRKAYEVIAGGLAKILENRKRKEVATVTRIRGPVGYEKTNLLEIIGGLLKNAFFKAILPGFEQKIRLHRGDISRSRERRARASKAG